MASLNQHYYLYIKFINRYKCHHKVCRKILRFKGRSNSIKPFHTSADHMFWPRFASKIKFFKNSMIRSWRNWILMWKMSPSIVTPDSKKKPTARKSTGGPQPYIRPPTPNSPSPEPELITLDSEDEDKEVQNNHNHFVSGLLICAEIRSRNAQIRMLERTRIWIESRTFHPFLPVWGRDSAEPQC